MTSSADVADLNGNIFGRTICPLSFVVIAVIFSELRGGGGIRPTPPVPQDQKKPALYWLRPGAIIGDGDRKRGVHAAPSKKTNVLFLEKIAPPSTS